MKFCLGFRVQRLGFRVGEVVGNLGGDRFRVLPVLDLLRPSCEVFGSNAIDSTISMLTKP